MDGWKCPVCKRGVSPNEKACDHGGRLQTVPFYHLPLPPVGPMTPTYPNVPSPFEEPFIVTCGNGGGVGTSGSA